MDVVSTGGTDPYAVRAGHATRARTTARTVLRTVPLSPPDVPPQGKARRGQRHTSDDGQG